MGKRKQKPIVVVVYDSYTKDVLKSSVCDGYVVVMPELDLDTFGSLAEQMMQQKIQVLCKLDIVEGIGEFREHAGLLEHLEKLYRQGVKVNISV